MAWTLLGPLLSSGHVWTWQQCPASAAPLSPLPRQHPGGKLLPIPRASLFLCTAPRAAAQHQAVPPELPQPQHPTRDAPLFSVCRSSRRCSATPCLLPSLPADLRASLGAVLVYASHLRFKLCVRAGGSFPDALS